MNVERRHPPFLEISNIYPLYQSIVLFKIRIYWITVNLLIIIIWKATHLPNLHSVVHRNRR